MTSIIENQLASIQSDDWAEIFRPTQDYAINPEEKLQSIIEEHLENAESTLAKTQAIKPLTDEDRHGLEKQLKKVILHKQMKHLMKQKQLFQRKLFLKPKYLTK